MTIFFEKTKNLENRGFTLIETLVAIAVLLLVIIGPMTIAQKGIQNAYHANNELTAVFLAQEAIEAVRQVRDADAIISFVDSGTDNDTSDWTDDLDSACKETGGCSYDGVTGMFGSVSCGGDGRDCPLYIDENNRYTSNSADASLSPFTRTVSVNDNSSSHAVVTVVVRWKSSAYGGTQRSVQLQTHLFNQYRRY